MLFTQLQLFRDIAHTGSLSRAAALHKITVSACSQQVQEWERALGVKLLDRSTRPLTLTPAGDLYRAFCEETLEREEQLRRAFGKLLEHPRQETVRVASIYSVGLSEMSQLETDFLRVRPDARLHVEYLRPEAVYTAVLEERADLGLVSYPTPRRELAVLPWRQEEMVVAVAPGHPLAKEHSVRPARLDGLSFIGFDHDLPIRRDVDRFLAEHGVAVQYVMHFDNLGMIKEAVALGSGVSLVPERILGEEVRAGRIVAVPLAGASFHRPLGIVHRRRKKWSPAAAEFLKLLQQVHAPVARPELTGVS